MRGRRIIVAQRIQNPEVLGDFSHFCNLSAGYAFSLCMSSESLKNETPPPLPQYTEEVMCANWNPLALMLAEPLVPRQSLVLDEADVQVFLARLYLCEQA